MEEYPTIVVDGQSFIVPDVKEWNGLLARGSYRDLPFYSEKTQSVLRHLVSFVSTYPSKFCLGFYREAYIKKTWCLMAFIDLDGLWYRVRIEYLICKSCGWSGRIANPSVTSLYDGLPNRWDIFRSKDSLQRVGCPVCGSKLPLDAVWAEPSPNGSLQ